MTIRKRAVAAGVLALLLMSGCGYGIQTAMFRPAYPSTEVLDVYRGSPPSRPYMEIAQFRAADQWNAMGRIVEKAKSVGADAIIVLPPKFTGTDYSALDSSSWVTPSYDLVVVAIKYK